jgi:peptidoglycan/xylan/chitin deacetylase (PgdA/CDA1 family)
MEPCGTFTVSLDFELYWGVRDKRTLDGYGRNLLGVRQVVPYVLDAFAHSGVQCTWATVGFLFFDRKEELLSHLPEERPRYRDGRLCPYADLEQIGPSEREDPYRYGLSLIRRIMAYESQEVATHTFSHYYCLEEGQTESAFRADLDAAVRAAKRLGISLRSLVFPRNQVNESYLRHCRDVGIIAYRGNEPNWMYQPDPSAQEPQTKRACRLIDAYVGLAGPLGSLPRVDSHGLVDIPSSRLLRPVSARLRALEPLRLRRIKSAMTHAARTGRVFHLWWHPHNFGGDLAANRPVLDSILEHYRHLRDAYGMRSLNMGAIAGELLYPRADAAA